MASEGAGRACGLSAHAQCGSIASRLGGIINHSQQQQANIPEAPRAVACLLGVNRCRKCRKYPPAKGRHSPEKEYNLSAGGRKDTHRFTTSIVFHTPDTETGNDAQTGSQRASSAMARDYDYLFKLLIIGDSGKERARMQDGKRASASKFCGELENFVALSWLSFSSDINQHYERFCLVNFNLFV